MHMTYFVDSLAISTAIEQSVVFLWSTVWFCVTLFQFGFVKILLINVTQQNLTPTVIHGWYDNEINLWQ